jgi:hypothetical protein
MPGLVPGIHTLTLWQQERRVDGRVKPGHDEIRHCERSEAIQSTAS